MYSTAGAIEAWLASAPESDASSPALASFAAATSPPQNPPVDQIIGRRRRRPELETMISTPGSSAGAPRTPSPSKRRKPGDGTAITTETTSDSESDGDGADARTPRPLRGPQSSTFAHHFPPCDIMLEPATVTHEIHTQNRRLVRISNIVNCVSPSTIKCLELDKALWYWKSQPDQANPTARPPRKALPLRGAARRCHPPTSRGCCRAVESRLQRRAIR